MSQRTSTESERLFQLLVESSPDAIVRHDPTLRCLYANSTFLRACGQTLETVIGALPGEWPFVFDVDAYCEHARKAVDTGSATGLELVWCMPDGSRRWSQVRMVPERDDAGAVVGVLSVCHDITQLKEVQGKLEKAEELAKIGFWELDFPTDTVRLSRQARRLMGKPDDWRASAERLLEIHPPVDRERVRRLYTHAFQNRLPSVRYPYEVVLDGQLHRFECHAEIAYSSKGQPMTAFAVSQDVTERVQAEAQLRAREQEFRVLVENTPDVVVRYDRDCRRTYVNPAMARLLGVPVESLLREAPHERPDMPNAHDYERVLRQVLSTGQPQEYKYRARVVDGHPRTWHMRIAPERNAQGEVVSVLAIGRDVSDFEETERRLQDAQRIARICHWEWNFATKVSRVSSVGLEVLGFSEKDMVTMEDFHAAIPPDELGAMFALYKQAFAERRVELNYEHALMLPDGSRRETHNWVRLEYGSNGKAVLALGVTQDVTDLKILQRQTHRLAFYDPLTQLPNRALLNDRLKLALQEAHREGAGVGLVLLDLDHFQKVNDSLGAGAGDELLRVVAGRLSQALRDYDTVSRLGGDEFAIIVPQIRQPSDMDHVAARIKKVFQTPIGLSGAEIVVSASAGLALYPNDGNDVEELLAHADTAMYHAKHCGRDNFQFYARELTAASLERLKLEADLRKAIERNELELFYQPKIELGTGAISGAEALMRWRHPERGLVPPDRFISIAEDTGLIIEMGEWALRSACQTAAKWHQRWPDAFKIAVNLSPRQFYSGDLVGAVRQALVDTGCQPEWIELEITESLLLNDRVDIRSMLEQLHQLGVTIAIDDFGTGYSALSYLTRFPVDTLKIDRSFIRELTVDRDSAVLAKAIVTLARSLRMEVVAEGVETAQQRDHLGAWGCHMVQGFLYSKPVPWAEFETLMDQWVHHQVTSI